MFEGTFFSGLKTGLSDSPQTLNQAFLVIFTAVFQWKNTKVGLTGNVYLAVLKVGMTLTYMNENEE